MLKDRRRSNVTVPYYGTFSLHVDYQSYKKKKGTNANTLLIFFFFIIKIHQISFRLTEEENWREHFLQIILRKWKLKLIKLNLSPL